jgi:hypothetical protein
MDRRRSEQITLEAGKTYRWSAEKLLALSLGNAGGATFILNGRPLQKFGQTGEVVRDVRIMRDAMRREVISSSNSPTIVRNIDGSVAQQATLQTSSITNTSSAANNTGTSPNAATSSQSSTTSQGTQTLASASKKTLDGVKSDSAKPRQRMSSRRRDTPKMISPVVPAITPPKPQLGKIQPPGTDPAKNNN